MPQVPTYQRQIKDAPLNPVFRSTPDVSSGTRAIAQGIGAVGEVADQIETKRATGEAQALEAGIRADWLKADSELREKYRGANVDGYEAAADAWWKERAASAATGASAHARNIAGPSLSAYRNQALASGLGYVQREREVTLDRNYAANVDLQVQGAVRDANPANAQTLGAATLQSLNRAVATQGAAKGWSTEQVQAEMLRQQARLHATMVESLMASPEAAGAYLTAHRDSIPADVLAKIEQRLKPAAELSKAQRWADGIMAQGLPLDAAMARAEKELEGDAERQAKAELQHRFSVQEKAQRDREQQAYGSAQLQVEQTGRVDPKTWAALNDAQRAAILSRQQAEAKARGAAARGESVRTDPKTYVELRNQAAEDPEAFARVDLKGYVDRLAPRDLEALLDLQGKAPKAQRETATLQQQMAASLGAAGIKNRDTAEKFKARVYDEIEAAKDANGGKPLNYQQRQEVIDREMMRGDDPGSWFGLDKYRFQIDDKDRPNFKPHAEQRAAAAPAPALPKPTTQAEFDALPRGAKYLGSDNKQRTKP